MSAPPASVRMLRDIARRHPNDPDQFGPPPRQQLFSGKRWDRSNEFWYTDSSGGINLYCNTDDFYVYLWRFDSEPNVTLKDHGVINCGGHFSDAP